MPHNRHKQDPVPGPREAPTEAVSANEDRRFDRWLSRRLHEAYDNVLKEALPADLERLVEQFSAEAPTPGQSDGSGPHLDGDARHDGERRYHAAFRPAPQMLN
jgi:hypothetical protein